MCVNERQRCSSGDTRSKANHPTQWCTRDAKKTVEMGGVCED